MVIVMVVLMKELEDAVAVITWKGGAVLQR